MPPLDGETPIEVLSASGGNIAAIPDSNEIVLTKGITQLHDALGSIIGGVNGNGNLIYKYTYDPFGNFTSRPGDTPPTGYGNVYGMADIEADPTGLYHANARYFSPTLMRFLNEDPERGKANMYSYAGNNPISGSDVSGMQTGGAIEFNSYYTGPSGGGETGNPANPEADVIGLIIQLIVGLSTPSSPSVAVNYQNIQNLRMMGKLNDTIGMDTAFNPQSDGGGQVLASDGNVLVIAVGAAATEDFVFGAEIAELELVGDILAPEIVIPATLAFIVIDAGYNAYTHYAEHTRKARGSTADPHSKGQARIQQQAKNAEKYKLGRKKWEQLQKKKKQQQKKNPDGLP